VNGIRAWSAAREQEPVEVREPSTVIDPGEAITCPRGHEAWGLPVEGTRYVECSVCGLLLTASRPADTLAA
jgi:hypothetical protein